MREVPYTLKTNSHYRVSYDDIANHEITIGPGLDIDLPYFPGIKEICVDIYILQFDFIGAPEVRFPPLNIRFERIPVIPFPLIYGAITVPDLSLNIRKNIDMHPGHIGHTNFQASTTWTASDEAMRIVIPALGTSWTDHYENIVFGAVVKVKPDVHFIGF